MDFMVILYNWKKKFLEKFNNFFLSVYLSKLYEIDLINNENIKMK